MRSDMSQWLSSLLRQARESKGLSARALSLEAGLSPSYVGKVEAGEIEPSLRTFAAIAVALELNPYEVFFCVLADRLMARAREDTASNAASTVDRN